MLQSTRVTMKAGIYATRADKEHENWYKCLVKCLREGGIHILFRVLM